MAVHLPIPKERVEGPNALQRFFGHDPKQPWFAAAKNRVLSGEFSVVDIQAIEREYGGDLCGDFARQWESLLEEIVFHVASDGHFDKDEIAFVREYVTAFRIAPETAKRIHRRAVSRAFNEVVADLIRDGELSDADIKTLEVVAQRFGISDDSRDGTIKQHLREYLQQTVLDMVEDGLVSDREWREFEQLIKALRVDVSDLDKIEADIGFARERWRVMYGQPVGREFGDLVLKRDELVYFRGEADWYESRAVRNTLNFAGPTGRIRIAKGLSFRYGSIKYHQPSSQEYKLIRTGELVLTNTRLLFRGVQGDNKAIAWKDAIAISIHSHNQFEVEKVRGKAPVIDIKGATFGQQFLAAFLAARLHLDATA